MKCTPDDRTREQLLAEIAELRIHLVEAEEALSAIREGEVDAIVVKSEQGDRLFTLSETENIYRLMIETMNEAGAAVTPDGLILFANNRLASMLDVAVDTLIGRLLTDYMPEEERQRLQALFHQARGGSANTRITLVSPGGGRKPVYMWASLLDRPEGPTICLVGTDLTQLEASEELIRHLREQQQALAESEERYRTVADFTRDWEYWIGPDGRFRYVSPSVERITGYAREEFLADPDLALRIVLPEDRGLVLQHQAEYCAAGKAGEALFRIITREGQLRWISHHCQGVRKADGDLLGQRCSNRDITDRMHVQQELSESEARYRSLAENIPAVLMRFDREQRVVYLSPNSEPVTGIPISAFIGRTNREMGMPEDLCRQWEEAIAEVFATGRMKTIEFEFPSKPEPRTFLLQFTAERDGDGRITQVLGISSDITDRKRLEDSLKQLNASLERRVFQRTAEVRRQADQLRALASELSRTEQRERQRLARVLHDHIQQLIVAARFRLESIKSERDPARTRATVRDIDGILMEAITASRSLSSELSPPVLQQAGLQGGLAWLVGRFAERFGLTIHLDLDPHAEPANEEIRLLLFECTRELLMNAAKHSGAHEARVTAAQLGADRLRITVEDAGKGFDPCLRDSQGPEENCFGLFSIEQRLSFLGGSLEIDSAPGRGTRAVLIAPLAAAHLGIERRPGPARAATPPLGVLIVDDHRIVREGLIEMLRDEPDIRVIGEASEGSEAIALVDRLAPDVVIMDVRLNGMDGIEATRAILRQHAAVKVIGLSTHADEQTEAAMRAAGAVAYLRKNGPCADLVAAIRACRPDAA